MTTEERLARLEQQVFPEEPSREDSPFEMYWKDEGDFLGDGNAWHKNNFREAWNAALNWAADLTEKYRVEGPITTTIAGVHNKVARNIRDNILDGKEPECRG